MLDSHGMEKNHGIPLYPWYHFVANVAVTNRIGQASLTSQMSMARRQSAVTFGDCIALGLVVDSWSDSI